MSKSQEETKVVVVVNEANIQPAIPSATIWCCCSRIRVLNGKILNQFWSARNHKATPRFRINCIRHIGYNFRLHCRWLLVVQGSQYDRVEMWRRCERNSSLDIRDISGNRWIAADLCVVGIVCSEKNEV